MKNGVPVSAFLAHRWQCDHFGHLNARYYAAAFDDAVFVFWDGNGISIPAAENATNIALTIKMELPTGG